MSQSIHCGPPLRRLGAAVLLLSALAARGDDAGVIVVIDEARGALVRWVLPSAGLPAAYAVARSVDDAPAETLAVLRPGQTGVALNPVWKETAEGILKTHGRGGDAAGRTAAIVLTLAEPQVAAWLGLSYEDRTVRPGTTVTYTVTRLAADGSVEGTVGTSTPVQVAPMRPPPAPADFRARATRYGVEFFWTKPPAAPGVSDALLYEIRRGDGTVIGDGPLLKISAAENAPGAFDLAPGIEVLQKYTITSLDIFGRRGGQSAPVSVFCPDFLALDPPAKVEVTMQDGRATLVWTAPDNPRRRGWKVARVLGANGVGQPLTTEPQTETRFEDAYVPVGVPVRYRVSAVNLRGEEGKPRLTKAFDLPAPKPGAPPRDVTAELAARRMVILRWTPPPEPVTGYYVERSTDGGKHWTLLKGGSVPEPRFVDVDPPASPQTIWYRVIAWGANDVPSAPSPALAVNRPVVPAPIVTAALAPAFPAPPVSVPAVMPASVSPAPEPVASAPAPPVSVAPASTSSASAPPSLPVSAPAGPAQPASRPAVSAPPSTAALVLPTALPAPPASMPPPAAAGSSTTNTAMPVPTAVVTPARTQPVVAPAAPKDATAPPPASSTSAPAAATVLRPSSSLSPAPTSPTPTPVAPKPAASASGTAPAPSTSGTAATAAVVKPPVASPPAIDASTARRPPPPVVNLIDGSEGKVSLRFTLPESTNGFFIFRSETAGQSGNVIASGLLASGRGAFVDTSVVPGRTYFYRLVAVDAAGNRSVPVEPPATVRVAARTR